MMGGMSERVRHGAGHALLWLASWLGGTRGELGPRYERMRRHRAALGMDCTVPRYLRGGRLA